MLSPAAAVHDQRVQLGEVLDAVDDRVPGAVTHEGRAVVGRRHQVARRQLL